MSMITGFFTALITPFLKDGSVDESGLRMLLNKQIEGGADGIVLLGTTGETPTLTDSEKKRITAIAREEIGGKIKLIVGTGTYSTKQTIENTRATHPRWDVRRSTERSCRVPLADEHGLRLRGT